LYYLATKDDDLVQMITSETYTPPCASAQTFLMIFSWFYSPFVYKFMTCKTIHFSLLKAAASLNTIRAGSSSHTTSAQLY